MGRPSAPDRPTCLFWRKLGAVRARRPPGVPAKHTPSGVVSHGCAARCCRPRVLCCLQSTLSARTRRWTASCCPQTCSRLRIPSPGARGTPGWLLRTAGGMGCEGPCGLLKAIWAQQQQPQGESGLRTRRSHAHASSERLNRGRAVRSAQRGRRLLKQLAGNQAQISSASQPPHELTPPAVLSLAHTHPTRRVAGCCRRCWPRAVRRPAPTAAACPAAPPCPW
jgi:hypothetical protein